MLRLQVNAARFTYCVFEGSTNAQSAFRVLDEFWKELCYMTKIRFTWPSDLPYKWAWKTSPGESSFPLRRRYFKSYVA